MNFALQILHAILKRVFFFLPSEAARTAAFEIVSWWGRLLTPPLHLNGDGPFYVNIGCGCTSNPGFISVDFFTCGGISYGADLRYPLRIADGTINGIFSEHTLEHLTYAQGEQLLMECYRILRPGGTIRIIVPDLSVFIRHYSSDDREWFTTWERLMFTESGMVERTKRRLTTPLEAVSFVTQEYGHVSSWDFETAAAYLKKAGFGDVRQVSFRTGDCPPLLIDLDSPDRKHVSLYVEARK